MPSLIDYEGLAGLDLGTKNGGGCGCGCDGSELVGLERARFFARQLVGPDDLTQDQTYFREKARRHNRMLHGWGIVCGAGVTGGAKACEVVVGSGYILGPYGDEIVIDRDVTFDVCSQGTATDPCGGADPWCTDVRAHRREGEKLYLAIRAAECDTRPVRTTACSCGCDDAECEYSRTRDSFELAALTELPDEYKRLEKLTSLAELILLARSFACVPGPRRCPPCPPSPWVILADLTLDADLQVTPDCPPHRRYVASFAEYFFLCKSKGAAGLGGLGSMLGKSQSMYMDASAMASTAEEPAMPAATVAVKTVDGRWMTVPGTFEVKPGETLRAMLAREGDRTLVDAASGETATVRELFASAGADTGAEIHSVADALSRLEGRTLDVSGLRVVRGAFEDVIDEHGLESLDDAHAGSPAAAPELPATALRGVETESAVGRHLAGRTVGDVAGESQADFVAAATKGLKGADRDSETERARTVWENARRVARLSDAWGG
jgi:hypothetical protein